MMTCCLAFWVIPGQEEINLETKRQTDSHISPSGAKQSGKDFTIMQGRETYRLHSLGVNTS